MALTFKALIDSYTRGGSEIFTDDLKVFCSNVSYKGFKPAEMRTALAKFGKPDLMKAILLFIIRGSKITKFVKKMDEAGVISVNELKRKMAIKDSTEEITGKTVTLGRIAICFPDLLSYLLHSVVDKNIQVRTTVLSPDFFALDGWKDNYVFLLHSSTYGLLPKDVFLWDECKDFMARVIHETSKVINPKYAEANPGDVPPAKTYDYARISYNSDLFTNLERSEWSREMFGEEEGEVLEYMMRFKLDQDV